MPSPQSQSNVRPLRPQDADEINVEALALSALLTEETWKAPIMGVTDEMFVSFGPVFEWCASYATTAGSTPPIEVVASKFPQLEIVAGYNLDFAVKELKTAHAERVARIYLHAAAQDLSRGDLGAYRRHLLAATKETTPEVRPVSITDTSLWVTQTTDVGLHLDEGMLTAMTGGIREGDLWLYAARLAVGKSWRLVDSAVYAALAGTCVTYFSLEMTAAQVARRAADIIGGGAPTGAGKLAAALEKSGGALNVFDPSHGRATPDMVASAAGDGSRLAVVDHLGLMFSNKGTRSIDDWRIAADISNTLKEVALAHKLPILAAAQINRTGVSSSTAPAAHQLAGTDAYGQDADIILTMRRASERVLVNRLAKNRWGRAEVMWYTRFLPATGQFTDLPSSTAQEWIATDADKAESQL
jgi:hypothetical protein